MRKLKEELATVKRAFTFTNTRAHCKQEKLSTDSMVGSSRMTEGAEQKFGWRSFFFDALGQ